MTVRAGASIVRGSARFAVCAITAGMLVSGCGKDNPAAPRPAHLDVSPAYLAFGNVGVGTSRTLTVTVTNSGDLSAAISPQITGGADGGQSAQCYSMVSGAGSKEVAGGETRTIRVQFTPNATWQHRRLAFPGGWRILSDHRRRRALSRLRWC